MNQNKPVTVVGSYNVGLFFKGKNLPQSGETVIGDIFYESWGGKGSNQAVAAATLGADVYFLGKIGNDRYGEDALRLYRERKISTDMIGIETSIHSGMSVIIIDQFGRNMISCVPGANFKLTCDDIDKYEDRLSKSGLVGFQLESPLDVVIYAIRKVHSMGVMTLLDPAPAVKLPDEIFQYITIIKPNETETEILTGIKVDGIDSAKTAAHWFLDKGVSHVIITMGANGVLYMSAKESAHFPVPKIDCVDSTGAGDIFSGSLMAALSKGTSVTDSIIFANHAASLSVSKLGVIESIPAINQVEAFMKNGLKG